MHVRICMAFWGRLHITLRSTCCNVLRWFENLYPVGHRFQRLPLPPPTERKSSRRSWRKEHSHTKELAKDGTHSGESGLLGHFEQEKGEGEHGVGRVGRAHHHLQRRQQRHERSARRRVGQQAAKGAIGIGTVKPPLSLLPDFWTMSLETSKRRGAYWRFYRYLLHRTKLYVVITVHWPFHILCRHFPFQIGRWLLHLCCYWNELCR